MNKTRNPGLSRRNLLKFVVATTATLALDNPTRQPWLPDWVRVTAGERTRAQLKDQVARQTVDYSAEWKKLVADLRALERKQEEVANAKKAQDQNSARLNGRVAEIVKQMQQEKEARVVTLRFPKERARTKRAASRGLTPTSAIVVVLSGKSLPSDSDRSSEASSVRASSAVGCQSAKTARTTHSQPSPTAS